MMEIMEMMAITIIGLTALFAPASIVVYLLLKIPTQNEVSNINEPEREV